MTNPSHGGHDRLLRVTGVGSIALVCGILGVIEFQHLHAMSATPGVVAYTALPLGITLLVVATVIWMVDQGFSGYELARVAAWVGVGMFVIGFIAAWTILHEYLRGGVIDHHVFLVASNLSAGGLVGIVTGYYDIQHRRSTLRANNERARLEFLHSSLRHNVLNGLNVILGNADLLAHDADPQTRDRLQQIQDRGAELVRFTEATQALLENFQNTTDVTTRPMRLADVVTTERDRLARRYDTAEFTVDIPPDLHVRADDFLAELFGNLLTNAIEHNDTDTPTVTVTATTLDDTVRVRVADNGPGIPDADKPRMQHWNVKGQHSTGTGLGLPIANTIAERYGGTLNIRDNHPRGTVVTVDLPRTDPPE